jgi:hypothetical protein
VRVLQAIVGAGTAGASYGAEMKNFRKRPEDVGKALKQLRRKGVVVGLPMQNASGVLLFAVEGFTITAAQLLTLLDQDQLDLDAVRKISGAQWPEGLK